jgi:hypothetical protein
MDSKQFHNDSVDINKLWFQSHKELIRQVAIELDSEDKVDELTEKFLGVEIKLKKFRDPKEPKKPKTGFLFFCDEFRPTIKKDQPTLKLGGMMKELGKLWGTYNDEDKEPYNQKYTDAKYIYEEKMEEYRDTIY